MIRKLLLAAAVAAGAACFAPAASAHDPRDEFRRESRYDDFRREHSRYVVMVKHGFHWHEHGTYRDREEAERVARRLERHGECARVERVGGWR